MLEYEYARAALRNGLKLEQELGVNPYKFGMIGSTDAHTGLAAIDEDNFWGKSHLRLSLAPTRATHPFVKTEKAVIMGWEQTASGYAGVWATENTREALFDAMQRKEVYATTGPRMIVRFFGGWEFAPGDANTRNPAVVGYDKGVPMGGDFTMRLPESHPLFLSQHSKIPLVPTLTASRSLRGGSTRKTKLTKKSTTSFGPATASRTQKANFPPWATPWTSRTQPTPTPSARRN